MVTENVQFNVTEKPGVIKKGTSVSRYAHTLVSSAKCGVHL